MASRFRASLAVLLIVFATLAVATLAILATRRRAQPDFGAGPIDSGRAPVLAARLKSLERSTPGNEGESGPSGYDEERFAMRAYPDDTIPHQRIVDARNAFDAIRARGVGAGRNTPGEWFLMGPTTAVYQSTRFRFSYSPGEYEASGRVTAMAIAPTCRPGDCRLWVSAAGGGVWRTDDALAGSPLWTFLSASIGINAIGSIQLDPNDPIGKTVWIGTGEANTTTDSAAGVGLYKSIDGGDTWTGPLGAAYFNGRGVGSIAIHPTNPQIVYVATVLAVRGVSATAIGGLQPGAQPWGLWKSTDGGTTFTFIHNGTAAASTCFPVITASCSGVGVARVLLDPTNPAIVYAASFGRGVWRSIDGGAGWTLIKPSLPSVFADARADIAIATLPDGKTRMYVGDGSDGPPGPYGRLVRSDDVTAATPVFSDLTSANQANPGFGSYNYCTTQCYYDNFVYTPPGHPDVVYLGGSFQYSEPARDSHGRTLVLSTDAGVSFTDMTKDATRNLYSNGLHPDQHALAVHPGNPFQFFSGSDGGVMRSSGTFEDGSNQCDWRPLNAVRMARCRQLLSRVPSRLVAINRGLATLQFSSLSVDPNNASHVMGGTQDNGTFETSGSPTLWKQTMWGDGGQSGFDAADNGFRFHTFFSASPEVNFTGGAVHDWNWIADRLFAIEPQSFYPPILSDAVQSGWMWAGLSHVWRTKTHGRGSLSVQDLRDRCNEFTGDLTVYCGDWEPLGAQGYSPPLAPLPGPWVPPPAPGIGTRLTYGGACSPSPCPPAIYGITRSGGTITAVGRGSDASTLWAATSRGRVFISKNADAEPFSSVAFTRIDTLAPNAPNRAISAIFVDTANPNRAWISYMGFNAATPALPGHVFQVVYDPASNVATWTNLDGSGLGDLPANSVVYDSVTADLYISTDFGVLRRAAAATAWTLAGTGMPNGEVIWLTIAAPARRLYAATHGLGAWSLALR